MIFISFFFCLGFWWNFNTLSFLGRCVVSFCSIGHSFGMPLINFAGDLFNCSIDSRLVILYSFLKFVLRSPRLIITGFGSSDFSSVAIDSVCEVLSKWVIVWIVIKEWWSLWTNRNWVIVWIPEAVKFVIDVNGGLLFFLSWCLGFKKTVKLVSLLIYHLNGFIRCLIGFL